MSELVLTGASGFVGRHFLISRPHGSLRALSRRDTNHLPAANNVEWVSGDINVPSVWSTLLTPDCTVINLAYAPPKDPTTAIASMRIMADTCAAKGVKRLIHCSTISVFGRTAGGVIDEQTACNPIDSYGKDKLALERVLQDSVNNRFDFGILRPSAVFGAGGRALQSLCRGLISDSVVSNYVRSSLFGQRKMHLVPVENVVAALNFLCDIDRPLQGRIFIVSEDLDPENNFRSVERVLMDELKVADYLLPPIPMPRLILRTLLQARGRSEIDPWCIYSSARLREWGFTPPAALVPAVRAVGQRYLKEFLRQ